MTRARQTLIVAGWEFRRYFKWKDQVISLVVMLLVSLIWYGAAQLAGAKGRTITIALVGLELEAPPDTRLQFVPAPPDSAARLAALREGEIGGILTRDAAGRFHLVVEKDPRFETTLRAVLAERVRHERLAAAGIQADQLARILAPPELDVRFTDHERQRRGLGEKIVAGVFAFVMLMGIFTSLSYLFTGITGEKQLRVTESVVAAVSPQAWIDGKILGLTAYGMTGVLNMAVGALPLAAVAAVTTGFTIPDTVVRPAVVVILLIFTVLGILLWNAFFGAVASTVDDPNTSTRSGLLMLPVVPVALTFVIVRDPDGPVARALAVVPGTSVPAMPVRLVLSDPAPLEVVASLLLLVAAILLVRRIAARVFEVGMLLYGKEPSWREITRWARARRAAG